MFYYEASKYFFMHEMPTSLLHKLSFSQTNIKYFYQTVRCTYIYIYILQTQIQTFIKNLKLSLNILSIYSLALNYHYHKITVSPWGNASIVD